MAHEDDLVALVDQLAKLEYERGRIRAQLEFHLRLREVAHTHGPVAVVRPATIGRGQLQRRIVEELEHTDLLSNVELTHRLGANSESVRQSLTRLVQQGLVRRAEKFKFALVRKGEAPSA